MGFPGYAGWTVQIDPSSIATGRQMLDLNTSSTGIEIGGSSSGQGIDWGQAAVTEYLAQQAKWGSTVIDFIVPNRIVTVPLGLGMAIGGPDASTALTALREKVALLQREGGFLKRQAQGKDPLYADIVGATLTVPDVWQETAGVEPGVTLQLECLPDFFGDEITLDAINATGEYHGVLQASGSQAVIKGDHPGRARILATDASGNAQFGLLWGFRSRYYSASNPLGYSAAVSFNPETGASVTALAGARGGNAIKQNLAGSFAAVCSQNFSHVGTYRVWARVYATGAAQAQVAWQLGDKSRGLIANPPATVPGTGAFYLVDLGQVTLPTAPIGVQSWVVQIQAEGSGSLYVDMVYLVPLDESAGRLQGVVSGDPVMLASNSVQLRHDSIWRAVAGGTAFTPVTGQYGDLPRIPPSGSEARAVELFMKASRGELSSHADAGTDALSITVNYRPSWLFHP